MSRDVSFAERLKKLSAEAGLSQPEFAGLGVSSVRPFEYGLREPTYGTLVKLARGLGVLLSAFESTEAGAAGLPRNRRKGDDSVDKRQLKSDVRALTLTSRPEGQSAGLKRQLADFLVAQGWTPAAASDFARDAMLRMTDLLPRVESWAAPAGVRKIGAGEELTIEHIEPLPGSGDAVLLVRSAGWVPAFTLYSNTEELA
jgi:transcriptional regulator with XRE-family HTH domain